MSGRRRLRPWLVAQVESGRFAGLEWDDGTRGAVRIPWKHAGKHDHGPRDAAFFQAWAEYKGRRRPGAPLDAASCKTRLRCALNKSSEFVEVPERSRLDGPRPYKVYRLLPSPPPRGGQQSRRSRPSPQQDGGCSPPEAPAEPQPPEEASQAPPPASSDGVEAAAPAPDTLAPPPPPAPAPPSFEIVMESPEPLPPAQGGAALALRVWLGGAVAWGAWLPPGAYAVTPRGPAGAEPLLPRLLLPPAPGAAPEGPEGAVGRLLGALAPGLLVASTARGVFVRCRGAAPVYCHPPAPHDGALERGAVVQVFDAAHFRQEVERHRAGLAPVPPPRVTLAVGQPLAPGQGPQDGTLVLQLEQAFAQPLLEGAPSAAPSRA